MGYADKYKGFGMDYGRESQDPFEVDYSTVAPSKVQGMTPNAAGPDAAQLGTSAASGAAMGGPAGAAVMVGGQLVSGYLAQEAQRRMKEREMIGQAHAKHGDDEQQAISQIMGNMTRALR